MNGDPNQTPPAGWQFKPDTPSNTPAPTEPTDDTSVAEAPPTIASDAPRPQDPSPAPQEYREPAEVPPDSVPTGIDVAGDRPSPDAGETLRWDSSEAPHAKPSGWMAMLVGGTVLLAVAVYFLTRDFVNAGAILAAGLLFGAYSARKPLTVQYQIDRNGIVIGQKRYPYGLFRSFAVEDGGQHGLVLMPLKRFMPLVPMHYPPELEDQVVGMLSDRLPIEAYRRDAMDVISRKLKF